MFCFYLEFLRCAPRLNSYQCCQIPFTALVRPSQGSDGWPTHDPGKWENVWLTENLRDHWQTGAPGERWLTDKWPRGCLSERQETLRTFGWHWFLGRECDPVVCHMSVIERPVPCLGSLRDLFHFICFISREVQCHDEQVLSVVCTHAIIMHKGGMDWGILRIMWFWHCANPYYKASDAFSLYYLLWFLLDAS